MLAALVGILVSYMASGKRVSQVLVSSAFVVAVAAAGDAEVPFKLRAAYRAVIENNEVSISSTHTCERLPQVTGCLFVSVRGTVHF